MFSIISVESLSAIPHETMINKNLSLGLAVFAVLVGCNGSDQTSMAPEIPSSEELSSNTNCSSGCDTMQPTSAGSGSIHSAFNGHLLRSIRSTTDFDGNSPSVSVTYYLYDSDNRTITRSFSSDADVLEENATLRSITSLTPAGLPDVITFFSADEVTSTEIRQYDSFNRLLSRLTTVEFNGAQQLIEYNHNDRSQPVSEIGLDPISRVEASRANYEYNSQGFLQTAQFSVNFAGVFETVEFQHDNLDRLSGFSAVNTLFEGTNTSGTYTWDENNNIVQIDTFDQSGGLTRRQQFEYIETEDTVFNSILFDYIYSPVLR